MRIGIDARFLTHPQRGGFKTYTTYLVRGLAAIDRVNEYVLYTDRAPEGSADALPANMRVRVLAESLQFVGMAWREQVLLARAARQDRLDVLHCPALTAPLTPGCPLVVTIHDMLWQQSRQAQRPATVPLRRRLMQTYYAQVSARSARRADVVLTVSQAAAAEITGALPFLAERIVITPEAAAPHFRPVAGAHQRVQERFALAGSYILAIGSADPRKNIATLVTAYSRLPESLRCHFPLVIVWTHGHLAGQMAEQVQALGLEKNVTFLQSVSDSDLVDLYNSADLFVFPSLGEGFGLPVLEAMACETAVIAADNTSIPEVAGDAALYFDARSSEALTEVLCRALADEKLRDDLQRRGSERAAQFSWERCAHLTIQAYERAAVR
jgi:glycosyltransferase involved in cell wall biosynthesis